MLLTMRRGENLPSEEVEEYLTFLKEGGAIRYFKTAREGLKSALAIIILRGGKEICAIGAIKARRREYNEKISERSGFHIPVSMREIGYIVVNPLYRGEGYSKVIVSKLLEFDDWVFATTSNPAMKATFLHWGFKLRGTEWTSKEGAKLGLWVRE